MRSDRRTGPSGDRVLEVDHLSIRFGDRPILADLTFGVARGSTLAVIGPNGAGKTVLFRALIGALPHQGTVSWAAGVRIGYVPQKLDLERDIPITGADLLRARAILAGKGKSGVSHVLDLVGIPQEVARQQIGTLSIGQFQRLMVGFALVGDPEVLLLDEPTSGVDEPGQERLNELVRGLQQERGLTILFISHELSVVYRYAHNVLCLSRRRVCLGPPRTILTPEQLDEIYGTRVDYHVHER